jgi:hypothetical protein
MTSDRPVLPVGTLSTRPDHAPTFVLQAREAAAEADRRQGGRVMETRPSV